MEYYEVTKNDPRDRYGNIQMRNFQLLNSTWSVLSDWELKLKQYCTVFVIGYCNDYISKSRLSSGSCVYSVSGGASKSSKLSFIMFIAPVQTVCVHSIKFGIDNLQTKITSKYGKFSSILRNMLTCQSTAISENSILLPFIRYLVASMITLQSRNKYSQRISKVRLNYSMFRLIKTNSNERRKKSFSLVLRTLARHKNRPWYCSQLLIQIGYSAYNGDFICLHYISYQGVDTSMEDLKKYFWRTGHTCGNSITESCIG